MLECKLFRSIMRCGIAMYTCSRFKRRENEKRKKIPCLFPSYLVPFWCVSYVEIQFVWEKFNFLIISCCFRLRLTHVIGAFLRYTFSTNLKRIWICFYKLKNFTDKYFFSSFAYYSRISAEFMRHLKSYTNTCIELFSVSSPLNW